MVEMKVKGVAIDATKNNTPVVILTDLEETRMLPIWIGLFEANAILMELENIRVPRPMTHDLLKNLIETLQAKVICVIVSKFEEGTFFAQIALETKEGKCEVDARPSDGVALALRVKVPIYVSENVVMEASILDEAKINMEAEEVKKWLDKQKPSDFGKYPIQ
jgi:hypothetical protein